MKLDGRGATCDAPFRSTRIWSARCWQDIGRRVAARPHHHVLAALAGYAYSDIDTVTMVMSRLGLDGHTCVCITQTVDAMLVFSTAYLVQSRCGRVAILCYRGTEPMNIGNWIADSDVGPTAMQGSESFTVHAGFYRNMRATRWAVFEQLNLAIAGRSLLNPDERVQYPLEALYVTGHSLGGAMAALFLLSVAGEPGQRAIADRLRAVYTFGQPLASVTYAAAVQQAAPRLFRHVIARDIVPYLPIRKWGHLVHFGREYRFEKGTWSQTRVPIAQMANTYEVNRSLLAYLGIGRRRSPRYTVEEHGPHHYIAALQTRGTITELGDRA
jgi:hypothetical protein